jgi:hypothetical protein
MFGPQLNDKVHKRISFMIVLLFIAIFKKIKNIVNPSLIIKQTSHPYAIPSHLVKPIVGNLDDN